MSETALSWAPSPAASRRALGFFTAGAALIGIVGFAVSFDSVMLAAWPYLYWAAWTVPVMVDLAIFVLTGLGLFMELHGLGARWIRAIPHGLALATLYLNTASQHTWFGRAVHAVGPTLWIVTVEIATFAVRRMVGLSDERRIEGLRRSLWLLRPWATWRIWRAMRVHQITTYAAALDREAARAAVAGRMRLAHGRLWRWRAPLAERIALRLDGRDPAGVAEILYTHAQTAALLAGAQSSAPQSEDTAQEPDEAAKLPAEQPAKPDEDQAPKPRAKRRRKPATRVPVRRTDAEVMQEAVALNAEVLAQTDTPVSVRKLISELHIGQPRAERIRAALLTADKPTPAPPIERANGSAL